MTLSEIAAQRETASVGTANALITVFASAASTAPEEDISLSTFINCIKNGHWQDPVSAVRLAASRGERDKISHLKRRLPAVTISCTMNSRAKDASSRARNHSGWLQADFDAKDNPALKQDETRAFLLEDPHVGAVFVGPSGVGIKAVIRIDPANHRASAVAAHTYFLDKYGLALDKGCKDLERLCFVSYDPEAALREGEATILSVIEAGTDHGEPTQPDLTLWTMADVRELLAYLPPQPDYDTWMRISSGVFSVLPFEPAVTVLKEWSPEKNLGEYEYKYRHPYKTVTIRSVIRFAQARGFDAGAAARRKRWMGRIIFDDNEPASPDTEAPHADLLRPDDEPEGALKADEVWLRFQDQQVGDAQLFVAREGQNLAYDHLTQCWRQFFPDTGLWTRDAIGSTQLLMSATTTLAYEGLIEIIEAEIKNEPSRTKNDSRKAEIEKLRSRCKELRSAKYIRDVMALARSIPSANRPATAYDRHRHLLAVANGVIDFDAQIFRPATKEDLLSVASPVTYNPDATCPKFDAFLDRAFDGDQDLVAYWWRITGYSLTGYVDHDALLFCYGEGANGKSTSFMVLQQLLGHDLSTLIDVNTLLSTKGDNTIDYKKSMLEGKRLVVTDELPRSRKINESMVKGLLGGDDIVARRPYEKPYTFSPTFKIWMLGNHKPKIIGTDEGIWRRIHLIPWLVTIPKEQRALRYQLVASFRKELPGILNSALNGYRDLVRRGGIDPPKAVLVATADYRQEEDSLAEFIAERTVEAPGSHIRTKEFYSTCQAWHKVNGETMPRDSANKLVRLIQRPPYCLTVTPGSGNQTVIQDRAWADQQELPSLIFSKS